MKSEDVKAQAEVMAAQIFKYVDTALSDRKEKDNLYCELSASFLTCALHDKKPDKAKKSITEKIVAIGAMCVAGYLNFLEGDKTRIVMDLTKYEKGDE